MDGSELFAKLNLIRHPDAVGDLIGFESAKTTFFTRTQKQIAVEQGQMRG